MAGFVIAAALSFSAPVFSAEVAVNAYGTTYGTAVTSSGAVTTAGVPMADGCDNGCSAMMLHKLGRGVVNLFTGFVEVPKCMAREWKRTDPITGITVGFFKGVGWGWTRTMAGAYEIATFPFPAPPGYAPLLEPEFVLTDIWGAPIPEITEYPDWSKPPTVPVY